MPKETPDLVLSVEEIQKLTNRPLDQVLAKTIASAASRAVRDRCGWRVAGQITETLTLSARSDRLLTLPSLHVSNIAEIREDGHRLELDRDYDWDTNGIIERLTGRWNRRRRKIDITLTHGFHECPGAIAEALAAAIARGTLTPAGNIVSETTLGAAVQFGRGPGGTAAGSMFLPHELEALDAFRIPRTR
ncbi:hypothetical protein K8P10_001983 [Leucobacter sp. Psy1]|uniref:hypothetical protein n=1 Tax=Leucobacter sp. Psy1 TaxID=2875729 RepID=UPI001CD307A0|nr:hypothetical protein [Leucobacter sp. Psy1]UBH06472.1 hypothetical protein K8P10_001983 [Leucobacter sp. Psy1]